MTTTHGKDIGRETQEFRDEVETMIGFEVAGIMFCVVENTNEHIGVSEIEE